MREKRVRDGQRILFDADELLDGRRGKGKVMVKMNNGPMSYTTEEGVKFWNKHPYQWVSPDEAEILRKSKSPEFSIVDKKDAEDFYLG